MTAFRDALNQNMCAGIPFFGVENPEIEAVKHDIISIGKDLKLSTFIWLPAKGLKCLQYNYEGQVNVAATEEWNREPTNASMDPATLTDKMLRQCERNPSTRLVINEGTLTRDIPHHAIIYAPLLDMYTENPVIIANIATGVCGNVWSNNYRYMVIGTPIMRLDARLRPYIKYIDYPYPTDKEIWDNFVIPLQRKAVRQEVCEWLQAEDIQDKIVPQLRGIHALNINNLLYFTYQAHQKETDFEKVKATLHDQKLEDLKRSDGIITIEDPSRIPHIEHVGGFDKYKQFIEVRKPAFREDARQYGIDRPRGVILLGVPGVGKSLVAKVTSRMLNLPLVTLNVSAAFNSLVGESERRIRQALKQISALRGCVVFIDEADKSLAGSQGFDGDGGTTKRVLGNILTWMQEDTSGAFLVMTMNNPESIPPEVMRDGRVDGRFFVDLPVKQERLEIIRAHFDKRGINFNDLHLTDTQLESILNKTKGYSGAELEQVVKDSLYAKFAEKPGLLPDAKTILEVIANKPPTSKTDKARIDKIRKFGEMYLPVSSLVDRE